MPKMKTVTCACGCGRKKPVRTADIARGWGKYYSKSCKAKAQDNRIGQRRGYINRGDREMSPSFDSGYFGHGQN